MTETVKSAKKSVLRSVKIVVNIILLLLLVTIGVQNAQVVKVSVLNLDTEISLTLLIFISGLLGILIALVFKLIKW